LTFAVVDVVEVLATTLAGTVFVVAGFVFFIGEPVPSTVVAFVLFFLAAVVVGFGAASAVAVGPSAAGSLTLRGRPRFLGGSADIGE
jgi:hypothetical protein